MSDLIQDFVVTVTKQETLPNADASYIRRLAIAVKPNTAGALLTEGFYSITSPLNIIDYTDNVEVQQAFDSGATNVVLFLTTDLDTFNDHFNNLTSSLFYTLIISSDFTDVEKILLNRGTFDGVCAFSTSDSLVQDDNIAEWCIFASNDAKSCIHTFVKLFLNAVDVFRNNQLITADGSELFPVDSLGSANILYEKRVSFYLKGDTLGTRLASFFYKKKPISTPYTLEEIKLGLQDIGTRYIADEQPYITPIDMQAINSSYITMFTKYITSGVITSEYTVTLAQSTVDAFTVAGKIVLQFNPPWWRMNIILKEV